MKMLIVVETTNTGYSAYSPDLDGCVATGPTRAAVERMMQEAVEVHVEGMKADGIPVPEPRTYATHVDVAAD